MAGPGPNREYVGADVPVGPQIQCKGKRVKNDAKH